MAVKYKREDVGPVVYCILNIMAQDLIEAIFKYAVERYHPDLEGLIGSAAGDFDSTILDLLNLNNDDPLIAFVGNYYNDITATAANSIKIYALNIEQLCEDKRIVGLAEELYFTLGGYLNETHDIQESLEDLVGFSWSLVIVLHYLCKLVVFEELVIEDTFSDDIFNSFYEDSFRMDSPHNNSVENMLFELMIRMLEYNADLTYLIRPAMQR